MYKFDFALRRPRANRKICVIIIISAIKRAEKTRWQDILPIMIELTVGVSRNAGTDEFVYHLSTSNQPATLREILRLSSGCTILLDRGHSGYLQ